MIELEQILCPFDFSETSTRALSYADAWTMSYDAHLEILHVVPTPIDTAAVAGAGPADPEHALRAQTIETEIRRVLGPLSIGNRSPTVHVATGRVPEVIVQRARAQPSDLLVMGTHGRSGVNRLLLGSVTEKVLRAAPCPVLTVPGAAATARSGAIAKRILCALDFSPSAQKALRYALALGRQADGQVTVLHALEYLDPEEPCEHVPFDSRQRRQHFIQHARARLHAQLAQEPTHGCAIDEVVALDRAYKAVLHHAAEARTDLIVMGAQGTGGLELLVYGSNTQHVLRAATCPVLTVHA